MRGEMIRLVIGFLMESQISVAVSQRLSEKRVKHNIVDALQRGDTIMQTQIICLRHFDIFFFLNFIYFMRFSTSK